MPTLTFTTTFDVFEYVVVSTRADGLDEFRPEGDDELELDE